MAWLPLVTPEAVGELIQSTMAKAAPDSLKPNWDIIISRSITRAYWTIVNAWQQKGYTKEQVDQWDRGEEFGVDMAAWWALKTMSFRVPDITSQQQLNDLDRRPELNPNSEGDKILQAVLTIGGVIVDGTSDFGQVHVGPMDTSEDEFVPFDPNDGRRGQPARF